MFCTTLVDWQIFFNNYPISLIHVRGAPKSSPIKNFAIFDKRELFYIILRISYTFISSRTWKVLLQSLAIICNSYSL